MRLKSKSLSGATALLLVMTQVPAYAEPALMLGLAFNFGAGESRVGATAKILSDNQTDQVVGAAGATYFFDDSSLAFDAGLGVTFDGGAITLTYDFTNESPQLSLGAVNTKDPVVHTVC